MGKPTSTLHSLGICVPLSLSRPGMSEAPCTRHSHASRSSGFVGAEAFTSLTALQQSVEGASAPSVRKGKHDTNESFAFRQLKPFTGFMAATVRTNTTARGRTEADTLFILCLFFL